MSMFISSFNALFLSITVMVPITTRDISYGRESRTGFRRNITPRLDEVTKTDLFHEGCTASSMRASSVSYVLIGFRQPVVHRLGS